MTAPKVLGVDMRATGGGWELVFGALLVEMRSDGPDCWDVYVADNYIPTNGGNREGVAAIERELLAIRAAIPAQSPTTARSGDGEA